MSDARTDSPDPAANAAPPEANAQASGAADAPKVKVTYHMLLQIPMGGSFLIILPPELQEQIKARTQPPTQLELLKMLASYPGRLKAYPLGGIFGLGGHSLLGSLLNAPFGPYYRFGGNPYDRLAAQSLLADLRLVDALMDLFDELDSLTGHGGSYGGRH